MNAFSTVMEIVAPVFLLAAIGYVWARRGLDFRLEFVTRLTMTLSVPCLIFVALMRTDLPPDALADLSMASLVTYLGVGLMTLAVLNVAGLDLRTYLAPLVFGNTGNLGLPLALFAFGNSGLDQAVVVFAVMAVLSFTIGVWVVSGGGNPLKVLTEPLVAATVLGAVFLWQGWQTPLFLTNTLELIGQMAIPLMLITLGVALARLTPHGLTRAVGLSLLKAAICGLTAWGVGTAFDLAPQALAILILQVSTPVAVTSYLLATKYGADAESVAGLVVTSTLLSVATLSLILGLVI